MQPTAQGGGVKERAQKSGSVAQKRDPCSWDKNWRSRRARSKGTLSTTWARGAGPFDENETNIKDKKYFKSDLE
jgi:hypothetical protein